MGKQVYELIRISNPTTKYCKSMGYNFLTTDFRNSIEAEMETELEDDPKLEEYSEEEWEHMLDKRVEDALVTLKTHGRYPVTGEPEFVYM